MWWLLTIQQKFLFTDNANLYTTFCNRALTNIIIIITNTSDLQPSATIANQLPGQLVSTHIVLNSS